MRSRSEHELGAGIDTVEIFELNLLSMWFSPFSTVTVSMQITILWWSSSIYGRLDGSFKDHRKQA
jgi:hypothetical protein